MPQTFNRVWWDGGYDREAGGCNNNDTEISSQRWGKSGSRRHGCVGSTSDHVRPEPDASGYGNPCTKTGANDSRWIGGGVDGRGNQTTFTGRSVNFSDSQAALKCIFNSISGDKLVELSGNNNALKYGVTSGAFKNQWEQLVFGVSTDAGNNDGFCGVLANLPTKIHSDGRTCYDVIQDAATKKARGIQWCNSNETDPRCACRNISQYGTIGCLERPNLPGCDKVVEGFNKFPAKAVTQFNVKTFPPLCFTSTSPCGQSDQYLPEKLPDVCRQTIAVCEQNISVGDITADKVSIEQKMECKAETTQIPGGSGTGTGTGEEKEVPISIKDITSNPRSYIPKSLDDLKTNKKAQVGVAGVAGLMMLCLILLLLVMIGGTSTHIAPRRFRR